MFFPCFVLCYGMQNGQVEEVDLRVHQICIEYEVSYLANLEIIKLFSCFSQI